MTGLFYHFLFRKDFFLFAVTGMFLLPVLKIPHGSFADRGSCQLFLSARFFMQHLRLSLSVESVSQRKVGTDVPGSLEDRLSLLHPSWELSTHFLDEQSVFQRCVETQDSECSKAGKDSILYNNVLVFLELWHEFLNFVVDTFNNE